MQALGQDARVRKRLRGPRWQRLLELWLHSQSPDGWGSRMEARRGVFSAAVQRPRVGTHGGCESE